MITLLTIITLVACIKIGFGLLKVFGKVAKLLAGLAVAIILPAVLIGAGFVVITKLAVPALFIIASVYVFKAVYQKVIES